MTTTTLAERLKLALEMSGKSQRSLAIYCGLSTAAVSFWLNGTTKTLSSENAAKAAEFLNVSLEWLTTGRGEMTVNGNIKTFEDGDTPPDDVVVIHEYKLTFGASPSGVEPVPEWELVDDGDDYWYKRTFFQRRHLNPDRCKRARVSGDSMEPTICDGDTFLFYEECDSHPGCVIIADGQIYAISVEGQLKVKRLSKTKDGIVVRSDNPDYHPEVYSGNDLSKLRIYGKIIEINRAF